MELPGLHQWMDWIESLILMHLDKSHKNHKKRQVEPIYPFSFFFLTWLRAYFPLSWWGADESSTFEDAIEYIEHGKMVELCWKNHYTQM